MLLETLVVCVALVEVVRLVVRRKSSDLPALPPDPRLLAIREKRRVLERDRSEWSNTRTTAGSFGDRKIAALERIDASLLKLADDEAALAAEDDAG